MLLGRVDELGADDSISIMAQSKMSSLKRVCHANHEGKERSWRQGQGEGKDCRGELDGSKMRWT